MKTVASSTNPLTLQWSMCWRCVPKMGITMQKWLYSSSTRCCSFLFLSFPRCVFSSYFAESTKNRRNWSISCRRLWRKVNGTLSHLALACEPRAHSMPVNINKRRWPTADSPIKSIYIYIRRGVTGMKSVSSRMSPPIRRHMSTANASSRCN